MTFALLTLLASLGVAAVTEWFSVVGIMAIYAGAAYNSALIMGLVLGGAKLVVISWLYRNWEYASWKLRAPLIYFTIALMAASSIGVYGFLTKAHLEQGAATIDNSAKIERLDQQIAREQYVITDNEKVMGQLDTAINSYLGNDKTDRALAVRKAQAPQRKQLKDEIAIAQKAIDGYSDERLKLTSEVRAMQLEVGPIKYIADLFYSDSVNATTKMESAVRIFTLLIVSTLDPLAVILLIAANHTILRIQNEKKKKTDEEISNGGGIRHTTDAVDTGTDPNKDVTEQTTINEKNIEEITAQDAEDENVTVRFIGTNPTLDEEASAPTGVDRDIKEVKWKFSDEVPEVPEETYEPSKIEELLISTQEIENTIIQSALPEIIINEEQINDLEKSQITDQPVEDITVAENVDNRQLEANTEIGAARATTPDEEVQPIQEIAVKKQPWASQPGVLNEFIGNSAHFIPQAIDEKSKKAELARRPEVNNGTSSSEIRSTIEETAPKKVKEMVENGSGQIQEENVGKVRGDANDSSSNGVNAAAANDKYPKALSWLTEFKGV